MSAPVRMPVLMYHDVADTTSPGDLFTVAPAEFEEHLLALLNDGRRLRAVGELLDPDVDARDVFLTFDDAFTSFAEVVAPLLAEHGARATVFVPTAFLGAPASWLAGEVAVPPSVMAADDLRRLPADVVEIGSHGHSHVPLDLLEPGECERELLKSRQQLEDTIGRAVTSVAYPFGYHHRGVRDAARRSGYRIGAEVGYSLHRSSADPLQVRRLIVRPGVRGPDMVRLVDAGQRSRAVMVAIQAARPVARWSRRRVARASHRRSDPARSGPTG